MFYEVIYENGEVSVLSGDSDEEILEGLRNHHDRAVNGGKNGPQDLPASRIKRVLVYSDHPGDYRASGQVDAKIVKKDLDDLVAAMTGKNGDVDVLALAENVKTLVHPMNNVEHPHDSRFKLKEDRELELDFA